MCEKEDKSKKNEIENRVYPPDPYEVEEIMLEFEEETGLCWGCHNQFHEDGIINVCPRCGRLI